MIKLTNCPICDNEKWLHLDHLRDHKYWFYRDYLMDDEPVGFKCCYHCGFLTYDYVEDKELKRRYDTERVVINTSHIVTANRKNGYHRKFFDEWEDENRSSGVEFFGPGVEILDVGSAHGAFLNLMYEEYGCEKESLYGSEWGEGLVAWANYENGLENVKATDWLDSDITFDLISYYHTLEHIQYPDKEIEKAKKRLSKNGFLYISVPIYGGSLNDAAGVPVVDFENFYHLNHVNAFTKESFHNFLKKMSLKIIKVDSTMYAYTVLCQVDESIQLTEETIEREDPKKVEDRVTRQKKAIDCLKERKYDEGIKIYPDYPEIWSAKAHNVYQKDFQKQKEVLLEAMETCGEKPLILYHLGRVHMQWDESKPDKEPFYSVNVKEAEKYFKQVLEIKPSFDEVMYFLAVIESKYKHNYDEAVNYLNMAMDINLNQWQQFAELKSWCWRMKNDR